MTDIPNPILVTGAHRSGTTWVGRMLAADANTAYVSEPLNVHHRPGIFRAKVSRWYQYICDENGQEFLPAYRELLDFDYHLWSEIRSIRSRRDFLRMGRDFLIFYNGSLHGQRALLKDPFAVFSLPWFTQKLNCKVIVTVRNPGAFASSLKRLNWSFDFKDLLDQPLLMRDHAEAYREEMQAMQAEDVIGQASLLWKIIYRSVHSARGLNPDFMIVRHEDLSRDPVSGFRDLYAKLGLDYTHKVEETIRNSSSSENPAELARGKTHSVKLDSRANMDNWKKRLSEDEIERIHKITDGISSLFYADGEW